MTSTCLCTVCLLSGPLLHSLGTEKSSQFQLLKDILTHSDLEVLVGLPKEGEKTVSISEILKSKSHGQVLEFQNVAKSIKKFIKAMEFE